MPASSTDVRAWLRDERGYEVPARGSIRRDWQEEYDNAHQPPPGPAVVPGEVLEDEPDIPLGGDGGVTGAAPPPPRGERPGRAGARAKDSSEKQPRRPGRGARGGRAKPKRFTERIFGSWGRKDRGPRQPLGDFAEETWSDLAWLAAPIPPLAKILEVQAPYAGAVFDDQVAGTFIDTMLQPVARNAGVFRALNGLAGPPLYVAMICLVGGRVQVHDPAGQPMVYPPGHPAEGQPVMTEDARTKMLFAGLKYSLLQMMKIGDENEEQIQARTEIAAVRNRAVDALVRSIFELPAPPGMGPRLDGAQQPPGPPQQPPGPPPGPPPDQPGFIYPQAPQMDGTGADPGRMV